MECHGIWGTRTGGNRAYRLAEGDHSKCDPAGNPSCRAPVVGVEAARLLCLPAPTPNPPAGGRGAKRQPSSGFAAIAVVVDVVPGDLPGAAPRRISRDAQPQARLRRTRRDAPDLPGGVMSPPAVDQRSCGRPSARAKRLSGREITPLHGTWSRTPGSQWEGSHKYSGYLIVRYFRIVSIFLLGIFGAF